MPLARKMKDPEISSTETPVISKHSKDAPLRTPYERNRDYKEIVGTDYVALAINLLVKLHDVLPGYSEVEKNEIIFEAMQELQPKDYVESMLCMQLISLHLLGVRYLGAAANADCRFHQDPDLNNGVKLLRLQHETLETLSRYRRKGEQRVVVQHVEVNNGGKAIVGGTVVGGGGVQR